MKADSIVYTSNTGYTRQYAEMLSRRTGLPVHTLEDAPQGGRVVYLGWMLAGTMVGLAKARKRFTLVACCPVGMGGAEEGEELQKKHPGLPLFYLRGGYHHSALTGIYKMMMNTFIKMMAKQPDDPAAQVILDAASRPEGISWITPEQLDGVAAWLEG